MYLNSVSYTHLRAHETSLHLVCRLLLEKYCFTQLKTLKILELRLFDIYKQSVLSYFTSSSKKKCIAKFRMSSHSLNIEKGRHRNFAMNSRLCELCDQKDFEVHFHFILKCPLYVELRKRYIKHYYYTKPSVFKLVQLLHCICREYKRT